MRPIVDSAYNRNNPNPAPWAGMNMNDLENAANAIRYGPESIAPAVSIPIASANAGVSAATASLSVASTAVRLAATAANGASGVNAVSDVAKVARLAGTAAVPGVGPVTSVANVARVAGAATNAVSGLGAVKVPKGGLPKIPLPKGKK
jgi:hypothetical protein